MEIRRVEDNQLIERKVVIYRHDFGELKLDDEALKRTCFIEGIKTIEKPITSDVMKKQKDYFLKTMKPAIKEKNIFVIDFNFVNAILFHGVKASMEKYGMSYWLIVSFFDDDETIIKKSKNPDVVIDNKVELLQDMMVFPYIQKKETPENGIVTAKYLLELFEEDFIKNVEILPDSLLAVSSFQ